jgi:uncharacterized protein involved in exopolysaccharide biosynthesis
MDERLRVNHPKAAVGNYPGSARSDGHRWRSKLLSDAGVRGPARIQLGIGLHVPANAPEGTAARLRTLADEIEAEGLTPSVAEEVNDAKAGQGVTQQDLSTNLNIEQIEDTRILQFSYTDTDQEKARLVVNHVADAHATQIPLTNQIHESNLLSGGAYPMLARIMHYATEPEFRGPAHVRNGLVAPALGLLLGIGLALLMERRGSV